MGICKCKRKTDLFCFVHKKAVCESCIAAEHKTCVIKTYVEWLTDSDYDPASCGICKGELTDDNSLRLTCLDLFHPECIDVYASSLPSHTAKAGYSCPHCSKPLFPSEDAINSNAIAKELLTHLSNSPWSIPFITSSQGKVEEEVNHNNNVVSDIKTYTIDSNNSITSDTSKGVVASRKPIINTSNMNNNNNNNNSTVISASISNSSLNSSNNSGSISIDMDEEEEEDDKYRKRNLTQLLTALGFINPSLPSSKSKSKNRLRLDTRRILIFVALLICLLYVFVMLSSMSSSDDEEQKDGSKIVE